MWFPASEFLVSSVSRCFRQRRTRAAQIAIVYVWMALGAAAIPASADIMDSINADNSPDAWPWTVNNVGWHYTPAVSYVLTGIETKFTYNSSSDGTLRTVIVEVYDEAPQAGGQLLRTADFVPQADSFTGGTFAALPLTAGEDYFIGFKNVGNYASSIDDPPNRWSLVGTNCSADPGAAILGDIYTGVSSGYYLNDTYNARRDYRCPILRLDGVPEPTSLIMLAVAGLCLVFLRRR